ncbi:MAG: putative serine/threonine protein kinase [Ilumatobacteraceae bacterium]|nr:putative serine/threonine protein kinase [Ilumatobacteraceae bacterium]
MTNHGERTVLNDRYEIQQRIGRGGMADVLLARDLLLDRSVAIKVLFAEFATDPNFVERFRREAQSAAALNHPNIVSVYDWGKYGGTYFIAMEYVEGRTLADIVRSNGRVSPVQAAEIASEVSAALAFAHRNGVVHRDIKPANILIGSSGQVKVADFGIARAMNSAADSNLTQVGLVMGTATYFSPEQAQGAQPDPRSDLYSLGIVMYEMVGGRPPFAGDNPVAIAYKQVHENPQPLNQLAPDVPRPYEAIVAKLLAKNPAIRYPDGDALRDDLRRFRNGEPVKALPGAATMPKGSTTPGGTTVARTVTPPRPNTGGTPTAISTTGVGAYAAATSAVPRTGGVPQTGAVPRPTGGQRGYPTGANEAVYYDPPQRRGWWGIAAFIAVVVLAVGGFLLFKALNNKNSKTSFGLIDVRNLSIDAATLKITEAGLRPVGVAQPDPEASEGVVYRTDPEPGVIVTKDQTITLYFNPQSELIPVPDVTGHTLAEAKDLLTGAGFIVGDPVTQVEDASTPIGQVISQTPVAQTPEKQGSTVNLTVSQGKGKVSVVKVEGTPADTAKSLLSGAPYNLVVTEAQESNDTIPAGAVIRTDPPVDTVVDKGSAITIYISTGPVQVKVPLLTGLLIDKANEKLSEVGLRADPITYQDFPFGSVNVNRVISQSIAVGQSVNSSSAIGLVVGRALPEETTIPPTTATPTTPAPPTTLPVATTVPPQTTSPAPTTTAPAATTTSAATPST